MRCLLSAPAVFLFVLIGAARAGEPASAPSAAADPAREFAELKIYDAKGRPWRAPREDWAGARDRVAHDPQWSAWLRHERAEVDRWMARNQDHVEWAAGWSHDGVSPKDGSRVVWVDRVPGTPGEPDFHSPSDPHIPITPKLFAWWVVNFRDENVAMMVRAASLYRLTGERRYAEWAQRQMNFYADNRNRFRLMPKARAPLFWQTLTEASHLVGFADTVRLLGGFAPDAERARWRAEFFDPEVALLDRTMNQIHNIATWQRSAAAQVALLYGDEAMWHEAIDGKWGLRRQLAQGVTRDGLWDEQSLGYNDFVVTATGTLFTAAGIAGREDELAPELVAAENLMLAPLYLRFPTGQLPNPADAGAPRKAPEMGLYANTYRFFPTPLGLTAAAGRRDWNTLLDPPPASPRPATLPVVRSWNLEATREAVIRSGPWQVYFHYGQLVRPHSQAEALNFEAFYGSIDITHDPGTVGYGSPLHRNYYTQGLNHNVPLIGGEGETPPQRGQLLEFSRNRVAAAQPDYRDDARAERTLEIQGDALIDTAEIESKAGPKPLGLALHFEGHPELAAGFTPDPTFAAGRPVAFSYWRHVTVATFRRKAQFNVRYGGTLMRVTVTAPGDFRLWHGSSPDAPPRRRDSFYLELAAPATQAVFTTRIEPSP